ncbi:hypothetical protein P389DRAFT_194562 [Cystobasidium minutum MCA 4210]|uniref:uncharacterized protein n=1 Tax=Cystobasidium minutum MCA 4210 TaxID=1397322 RepID=UPI0034CEB8B1|eukprot:jgi/Rhomi1/194562/gm1.2776_g
MVTMYVKDGVHPPEGDPPPSQPSTSQLADPTMESAAAASTSAAKDQHGQEQHNDNSNSNSSLHDSDTTPVEDVDDHQHSSFPPPSRELSPTKSALDRRHTSQSADPHAKTSNTTTDLTLENGNFSSPDKAQSILRCLVNLNKPAPPVPPKMNEELSPLYSANIFSKITFSWITPLMALGYQRPLAKEDLWALDVQHQSEHLADQVITNWERRLTASKEWNAKLDDGSFKPSLLRKAGWRLKSTIGLGRPDGRQDVPELYWAVSDTFKLQWWSAGILKVIADTLSVTSILVTRRIITYATGRYLSSRGVPGYTAEPVGHGVGWAFLLFFMLLGSSLCLNFFFYNSMQVGVFSRGALIAALYRRAMTLSGKARATISNGRLVNHISTDISRIDFAAGFFHMSWTAPVQLIVVIIILIVQLGATSLTGVAFLFVMAPLQGLAMKRLLMLRRKTMVWTDKRVKLIQELLGGMRVIKFFAWEVPYLNKIHQLRREELKKIRSLLIIRSLTMAVAMALPTLATVIAFFAYAYTGGNSQDPATIFTSLTLFNLLRMPLMMLPVALATATDAKNAFSRLKEVFVADQLESTYTVDKKLDAAVVIKDGTFMWEGEPPEEIKSKKQTKKEKKKAARDASKERKAKGTHDAPAVVASEKAANSNSKKKQFWKRKGDLAMKDQASNDVQEKDATTMGMGQATDAAVPVADDEDREGRPSHDGDGDDTPHSEQEPQVRDINITIPRGQLCAIVGPVGAGKSSLLSSMIGEMKRMNGTVTFGGSVGYCAQQAWIQNATLRDNILFGKPYNEKKYEKAIFDACLNSDLAMLPDGDMTEIGEKGITLSGGQKQRVNIARALYFDADITLFDDPLSAVDSHVGQHLFKHALQGALAGKTRILVTHALHFLPYVDNIITIDNGQVVEQGTYTELMAREGAFSRLVKEFGNDENEKKEEEVDEQKKVMEEEVEKKEKEAAPKKVAQKLMQEEEKSSGTVGWPVYRDYLIAARVYMGPLVILSIVLMQGATIVNAYSLTWWTENAFNKDKGFYLGIYAGLGVSVALFTFMMGVATSIMGFNVSVKLHRNAITRVLYAPMSLFDTTPLGRIMNRFGKDMDTVDNTLNDAMRMALSTLSQVFGSIILIAIVQQYFLIAVAVVFIIYADFFRVYRYSARDIKRLDNVLRSGLYAHFSESLSGLATLRAYAVVPRFIRTNSHFLDIENRAYSLTVVNQRWLGIRLDFLGALLSFVVAIIAVLEATRTNPSQIGLALSYIIAIQMGFTFAVRQLAEVENDMNSVERLTHYGRELEQEAAYEIAGTTPPKEWPQRGEITFKDVKLRYRPGLPLVLDDLSFEVHAAEKVAVVGRTGAGKSSLMQAIFRIVELDSGSIVIDGLNISSLGLGPLRKGVSIIPQDALLFSGTLRTNLDPFGECDDHKLWDALRRAHLVDRGHNGPSHSESTSRFNLDMKIEDEGNNLSVGERSLVSLARALVKDSRVVILDEATASVDVATDALIQKTIRTEFGDKTLLTIAHRLRTIISYDRVLVMDKGHIAEFASPLELFDNVNGIFRGMCDSSSITKEDIEKSRFETFQEIAEIEASETKAA